MGFAGYSVNRVMRGVHWLRRRPFVARAASRAVDQSQHLPRLGQQSQQRMIAPASACRDIHPLLLHSPWSPSACRRDRSSRGRKGLRLPRRRLATALSAAAIRVRTCPSLNRRQKSPVVVGSGIRSTPNALRNISSLRPSMSSSRIPSHRVVGQVEHVIRFVVWPVDFQHVHVPIDGLHQPDFVGQPVHLADPALTDGSHLVGRFHLDQAGGEHRPATVFVCPGQRYRSLWGSGRAWRGEECWGTRRRERRGGGVKEVLETRPRERLSSRLFRRAVPSGVETRPRP